MDFWDRVKTEVKRQNTTQDWVAEKSSILVGTFRGWIARDRLPDAADAFAISQTLGVSVEYLVTGHHPTADAWTQEHRQLIDDLKALTPERLDDVTDQVSRLAEKSRTELGKAGASG